MDSIVTRSFTCLMIAIALLSAPAAQAQRPVNPAPNTPDGPSRPVGNPLLPTPPVAPWQQAVINSETARLYPGVPVLPPTNGWALPEMPGATALSQPHLSGRNESAANQGTSFGWMSWWEINAPDYLFQRVQKTPAHTTPAPDTVVAALLRVATNHALNPRVRAEAVLSLGMMRQPSVFEPLRNLATKDADDIVRLRAWAAIGLLNSPQAAQFLARRPASGALDTAGWAIATGLLQDPYGPIEPEILAAIDDARYPESQRLAIWALRVQHPPDTHEVLLKILGNTHSPVLFREALAGLGNVRDEHDITLLTEIIHPDDRVQTSAPLAWTTDFSGEAELALGKFDSLPDDVCELLKFRWTLKKSREMQGLSGDMSPAESIALGRGRRLVDLSALEDVLGMGGMHADNPERMTTLVAQQNTPQRGYAALGMGLFLRHSGDKGNLSAPGTEGTAVQVGALLLNECQLSTEVPQLRAACALAAGLSKDPQNARFLGGILDREQNLPLTFVGYSILAMGLLGDEGALDHAAQLLGPPQDKLDTDVLLEAYSNSRVKPMSLDELVWRRAAVQGLAALHSPRAVPLLIGQWGRDDVLSLDVARAMAACRSAGGDGDPTTVAISDFSDALLKLATQTRSTQLAAGAAGSLGILYDQSDWRVARLIDGVDYSIPPGVATQRQLAPANGRHLDFGAVKPQAQVYGMGSPFYYLYAPRPTPAYLQGRGPR